MNRCEFCNSKANQKDPDIIVLNGEAFLLCDYCYGKIYELFGWFEGSGEKFNISKNI